MHRCGNDWDAFVCPCGRRLHAHVWQRLWPLCCGYWWRVDVCGGPQGRHGSLCLQGKAARCRFFVGAASCVRVHKCALSCYVCAPLAGFAKEVCVHATRWLIASFFCSSVTSLFFLARDLSEGALCPARCRCVASAFCIVVRCMSCQQPCSATAQHRPRAAFHVQKGHQTAAVWYTIMHTGFVACQTLFDLAIDSPTCGLSVPVL